MDAPSTGGPPKRKWKKKKTLLSNAKKYEKKGCWGRGSKISEDMYHYFVGILEVMKNGFDDDEEKANFVNNVLERTIDEEITLSCNQLGCRIVEQLLPYATPEALERYITAFSDELRVLSSDNFSSFVLEQLLTVCCNRATQHLQSEPIIEEDDEESDQPPLKKAKTETEQIKKETTVVYPEEHIEKCHAFTIKMSKYLLNNLEDFVWDPSANRILRTSIKCLGGVVSAPCEKPKENLFGNKNTDQPKVNINKHSMPLVYRNVPDEFKDIVKEHATRLSLWPQFIDMPYETLTSGLLQILIYALKNTSGKQCRSICKKLLDESFIASNRNEETDDKEDIKDVKLEDDEDVSVKPLNLPPVFDSVPAVRLLEAVIQVSKSKIYTQVYAKLFINRLEVLSTMPGLNFTVQRLFDNCAIKEEFEPMFDELADKFDKILKCSNTGVIVAIAKACHRLQCKQVKFIQALEQALKCSDSENHKHFAVLCARLLPLDRVDLSKHCEAYFVSVHGSVILQTLLGFQRPKRVIDSFLAMGTRELVTLFCDAKGSHIADGFFQGQFVGAKSREILTKKLKGTFQELAISKYGSRAVEKIFKTSSFEQKVKIMEELAEKSLILNSTMFGQVVATNLKVELYKKSFQSWQSSLDKEERMKNAFKDILTKTT